MFLRVMALTLLLPASALAAHPLDLPVPLRGALETLRNGHYRQTLGTSRSLQKTLPRHPLPALLAAEATWGLIFCQTGHITSREILNEAENKTSSFDEEFFHAVEDAIAAGETMQQKPQTSALGAFY